MEPSGHRQQLLLKLIYEDERSASGRVRLVPEDPDVPRLQFQGRSARARASLDRARRDLEEVMAPLPIADAGDFVVSPTESHILGTAVMGDDSATSVVDAALIHHRVRNLLVLGSSAFPTAAPANPTLTLSALSRMAARKLWASAHA